MRMNNTQSAAAASELTAQWMPSCNSAFRMYNAVIDTIVIHHTELDSFDSALRTLRNWSQDNPVSAHYLIGRDGQIAQLVMESDRAWHAGVSSWHGRENINHYSIGIELDNNGHEPFSDIMMERLIALIDNIMGRRNIAHIVGHADIAPSRRADPSIHFDWQRLADHGIGHYPTRSGTNEVLFCYGDTTEDFRPVQAGLARLGYAVTITDTFDDQTAYVINAFRRHYAPANFAEADNLHASIWNDDANVRLLELLEIQQHAAPSSAAEILESDNVGAGVLESMISSMSYFS
jgi:N-acetylmuramoyl-L-alanine amidase